MWLQRVLQSSALLLVAACGTQPISGGSYTVKRGDTLYAIATRHDLTVSELARLNRLSQDEVIYPGQVLRLSPNLSQRATRKPQSPAQATIIKPLANTIHWQWPVANSPYALSTRPNGGLGLMFTGKLGDEIRTTAPGRVVYSGTGLLGYGQLLIIKHDESYLSAYGHIQAVRVREGDSVNADQLIATMGNGPAGTPLLYFEIRINGQPIDPLPLLQRHK